jgi:hypothetical protein
MTQRRNVLGVLVCGPLAWWAARRGVWLAQDVTALLRVDTASVLNPTR